MLQIHMLQQGKAAISILLALLLGGSACLIGYTAWHLQTGTGKLSTNIQATFSSHTRKLEILELRLALSRMTADALSGAVIGGEGTRSRLSDYEKVIQLKFYDILSRSSSEPSVAARLKEIEPHIQALFSSLHQSGTTENLERWRTSATEIESRLNQFAADDDKVFERNKAGVDAALAEEAETIETLKLSAAGTVVCALLASLLYLVASFRVTSGLSGSSARTVGPVSDLRSASFNQEVRSVVRFDHEVSAYRQEFISSFAVRLHELETAIDTGAPTVAEFAQALADAADAHGLKPLSMAARALETGAVRSKSRDEQKSLLSAVKRECQELINPFKATTD